VTLIAGILVSAVGVWLNPDKDVAPLDLRTSSSQSERTEKNFAGSQVGISAKVIRVSDGDTITLLKNEKQIKVRLLGIDAPEKNQPFGKACRESLAKMVAGREVQVLVHDTDRYGRSLGKVISGGKDVNLAQIESGCAWHYKQYQKNQTPTDRKLYSDAEQSAKLEKRGLWKQPEPDAPWAFRQAVKKDRRPSS